MFEKGFLQDVRHSLWEILTEKTVKRSSGMHEAHPDCTLFLELNEKF